MIEARNLSAAHGRTKVLRGVDLRFEDGQMVGLLGPNGAGKTSLLLALSGLLRPSRGEALLDGRPVRETAPRARAQTVAVVPQQAETGSGLRCLSVVLMGRRPHLSFWGGYTRADLDLAVAAMRETGVEELAERRLDQVSGGEFKRVLIARALAQDTPALLLDEAAAGLDAAAKMAVCEMMAAKAAKGSLVLAVMHDLNLAALFCHRLVFLKRGRVVLDGPTADVFTRQTLSEIYETPVCVAPHPVTGAPQALFVPASATDAV